MGSSNGSQKMREGYASPGLRWGLALEDHPQATREFREGKASEFGVPANYGGDRDVCVCTIEFPCCPDREPAVGWKYDEPRREADPEDWNQLCTKTMGRALKAAGYPDDMPSLKGLILWRQRRAEVALVAGGQALAALGSGDEETDRVLDAAATEHPDATSPDDAADHPDAGDQGDHLEVESWEDGPAVPPSDATMEDLKAALAKLKGDAGSALLRWASDRGWRASKPETETQAVAIVEEANRLAEEVAAS